MALDIQREKFVFTASINRPESMNAINFEVMSRLETVLDEVESDADVRLFVLTGTGNSFISGGDLREFHKISSAAGARKMSERMISILNRIKALPCWTLAAINGHAYGGGWETLLQFDFRVAKETARFGFTQGKFYLPPGWGGITSLTETVGRNKALFWLASQKVISAQTAFESGLIQDVFTSESYGDKLSELKNRLILNDRTFIEYVKNPDRKSAADEIEPFSRFWENSEHLKRVNDFLERKES